MKFHKQRIKHDPENGQWGDCARTAIACILDLEPEEVPHENRELSGGEQFDMHLKFLNDRGLHWITIPFKLKSVDEMLKTAHFYSNHLPYMLCGSSPRGTNHVVIGEEGAFLWDPSPSDGFLIGPGDDGHFWLEMIVRRPV